jgi:hypothetical protein
MLMTFFPWSRVAPLLLLACWLLLNLLLEKSESCFALLAAFVTSNSLRLCFGEGAFAAII